VELLEGEHDNLREALSRAIEHGERELGLRLCGAFWRFWLARGYLNEGRQWTEQALASKEPAAARVKALEGMGELTQRQGDTARARVAYEEMLELSRELGDKGKVATALNSLGTLAVGEGTWPGSSESPLGRHACGGRRRRRGKLSRLFCHPASGRCTNLT
jgi:hypothetical protein